MYVYIYNVYMCVHAYLIVSAGHIIIYNKLLTYVVSKALYAGLYMYIGPII